MNLRVLKRWCGRVAGPFPGRPGFQREVGFIGAAGWNVVGCTMGVLFAVAVLVVDAVVLLLGEVCPGLGLAAPLRPLAVLLPFLTVLRGVTSLTLGGGVRRVARVAEVVTAVPLTRVPTRLCRCGARLLSPLALLPFAE